LISVRDLIFLSKILNLNARQTMLRFDKLWCEISILLILTEERSILIPVPASFQGICWWVTSNGKFQEKSHSVSICGN